MKVSWDIYAHWLLHRTPLICTTLCFSVAIKTENLGVGRVRAALIDAFCKDPRVDLEACLSARSISCGLGMGYIQIQVWVLAIPASVSPVLEPGNDLTAQTDLQGIIHLGHRRWEGTQFRAEIDKAGREKRQSLACPVKLGRGLWGVASRSDLLQGVWILEQEVRFFCVLMLQIAQWEEVNSKPRGASLSLFARSLYTLCGRSPAVAVVLRLHQRLQCYLDKVAISSLYPLAFLTFIRLSMFILSCDHIDVDLLPNTLYWR